MRPAPAFADLVAGRVPAHVVAADAAHVAFLAPRPQRPGHVIVAARRPTDQLFDLPPDEYAALWAFVRALALHMRERLPCERICVSVIGWVVRHAHVHLVPTTAAGQVPGLDGEPLTEAVALELAQRLRA